MNKQILVAILLLLLVCTSPVSTRAQAEVEAEPHRVVGQISAEDMVTLRGQVPVYTTVAAARLDSGQSAVIGRLFNIVPSSIQRFRWSPSMATAGSANSGTTLYVVWYGDSAGQTKVELRIAPSGAIVDHSEPDLAASTIASKRTEAPVAEETGRASFEHTLQAAAPPPSGKSDSAASPTPAVGGKRSIEIGTYAGLSIISPRTEGAYKTSNINFPGGGILGLPVVHVSFLGGRNLAVENQIHYSRVSNDLDTISALGLGWRVAYLFAGTRTHSPYVAGHGTLLHRSSRTSFGDFEDEDSDTNSGLGFGFGYRFLVRKHIALRLEGAYHHWFDVDVDTNEYALRLGFATVLATRD
jgi:hypothetical protein